MRDLREFEERSILLSIKSSMFLKILTVLRHSFKKQFLHSPGFQKN